MQAGTLTKISTGSIMPGKYTKKHTWKQCEYVYERCSRWKKEGDRCDFITRMVRDGRYLCWLHSPKRQNTMKDFLRTRAVQSILKHEERIRIYKERYQIVDARSVAAEKGTAPSS